MSGFVYVWRQHTARVTGSATKHVRCAACATEFEYVVVREGRGGGHAPLMIFNNTSASEAAASRARADLRARLENAIEAVHCPCCGIYQPNMVDALRRRYGRDFDPNKLAFARLKTPLVAAWRHARTVNSKESYKKFMATWPVIDDSLQESDLIATSPRLFHHYAKEAISTLQYPALLRKIGSNALWVFWGGCVLIIAFAVVSTIRPDLLANQ